MDDKQKGTKKKQKGFVDCPQKPGRFLFKPKTENFCSNNMKTILTILLTATALIMNAQEKSTEGEKNGYKPLTEFEKYVILDKGTERPFTGEYHKHDEKGTYVCKRCGAALYESNAKFDAHCGWPSFDDEIDGAVLKSVDADGRRTEITCANCGGHLGHVFYGEGYTDKNTRHCVNSVSMDFIPAGAEETKKKGQ